MFCVSFSVIGYRPVIPA